MSTAAGTKKTRSAGAGGGGAIKYGGVALKQKPETKPIDATKADQYQQAKMAHAHALTGAHMHIDNTKASLSAAAQHAQGGIYQHENAIKAYHGLTGPTSAMSTANQNVVVYGSAHQFAQAQHTFLTNAKHEEFQAVTQADLAYHHATAMQQHAQGQAQMDEAAHAKQTAMDTLVSTGNGAPSQADIQHSATKLDQAGQDYTTAKSDLAAHNAAATQLAQQAQAQYQAAQQAQAAANHAQTQASQAAAVPAAATLAQAAPKPPKAPKVPVVAKDNTHFSTTAAAQAGVKGHLDKAEAAKLVSMNAAQNNNVGTPLDNLKNLQVQQSATKLQIKHLDNALHVSYTHGQAGAGADQMLSHSQLNYKLANAKAHLKAANAKIKQAQIQAGFGPTAHTPSAASASAHSATFPANPGNVAGAKVTMASVNHLSGQARVDAALSLEPSSSFINLSNSHPGYQSLIDTMAVPANHLSVPQKAAVKSYTGIGYGPMNSHVAAISAGQGGTHNQSVITQVKHVENAIQSSSLPENMTLFRGINLQANMHGLQPGDIFTHGPFASTSTHESSAFHKPILLQIEAPKGSKGLYVSHPGQAVSVQGAGEREIILQRGYKMLLISKTPFGNRERWHVRLVMDD